MLNKLRRRKFFFLYQFELVIRQYHDVCTFLRVEETVAIVLMSKKVCGFPLAIDKLEVKFLNDGFIAFFGGKYQYGKLKHLPKLRITNKELI